MYFYAVFEIRNMLFLKLFEVISGQKNPKNSVKIRIFKGSFKKSCFESKKPKSSPLLDINILF